MERLNQDQFRLNDTVNKYLILKHTVLIKLILIATINPIYIDIIFINIQSLAYL